MTTKKRNPKDKWILICFLAFFGVIFIVNGVFIYTAIRTQPGLVTDNPYEKGLNFNKIIQKQKNQPSLKDKVSVTNDILRWQLRDKNGKKITNADVTAHIIRPVQEGYDFHVPLTHKGNGVYEAKLDLPLDGLWSVKLESQWDNKQYKTTHQFIKQ